MRQLWIALALFASMLANAGAQASAQNYPSKPIRLVIPFTAGSSTDILGREVARELTAELGQPLLPDNRPGAQATIGAAEVARATPDGYTLLIGTSTSQSAAPSLVKKIPYDPVTDFSPIARLAAVVFVVVVRADLPIHSVAELIDYGKRNPGKLRWGYANSANQVSGAAIVREGKLDATPVPYKGVPQIVADMLSGVVDFTVADLSSTGPQITSGKLRALAVTSEDEMAALPGVPPLHKTLKNFQLVGYYGLFAPASTSPEIVKRLSTAMLKRLATPEMQQRIVNAGMIPFAAGPAELQRYVASEMAKWAALTKATGIEPE